MKPKSTMIRLDAAIMETARHISTMTGMSITAVIEEACRGYFKAWLQGASAGIASIGNAASGGAE